jgi:hypothetical protein
LDTRNKILTLAAACALREPLTIASGTFDILLAEDARELEELRGRNPERALLVAVLPAPSELLSARARAEIAAALRMVDYVVILNDGGLLQLSCAHPDAGLVRLEAAHARRMRQLIEHVRRRQAS